MAKGYIQKWEQTMGKITTQGALCALIFYF